LESLPVVFDFGSSFTKIGFAKEDEPRFIFPTIVGYPVTTKKKERKSRIKDIFVGYDVYYNFHNLNIIKPVNYGQITDWTAFSALISYSFSQLNVNSENHPVLVTESAFSPQSQKEKIGDILFDNFKVPRIHFVKNSIVSLYASGRTSGVVINFGEQMIEMTSIYEGFTIDHDIRRINIGGENITTQLRQYVEELGIIIETPLDIEKVRKLKEKLCFVSLNPNMENKENNKQNISQFNFKPTKSGYYLSNKLFQAPEIFFQPDFQKLEKSDQDLVKEIFSIVYSHDVDLREIKLQNIVLSGGTSKLSGLKERLNKELTEFFPPDINFKIIIPPNCEISSWIGGSILAGLRVCFGKAIWQTRDQFKEYILKDKIE